ncbi:hypothetical protein LTR56_002211 [Elasticomyces elasticus]|nr:hypothetical protein LTR56_002211 [Elasticomyces elasticus]KAK3666091.1 hypothetical protein LTR22_003094 [Elasticomyces elasticus]KAK4929578.1 hypothetical protein LTR49_003873 [Elasticomyces elasticus]KAK5767465.1 hypothetical protein LTS12_002306 [Elasticomyces elasticus]
MDPDQLASLFVLLLYIFLSVFTHKKSQRQSLRQQHDSTTARRTLPHHDIDTMRFITTTCLAITVLLALPTCNAVSKAAQNNLEGTWKPLDIAALLPETNVFEDYKKVQSAAMHVDRFARTAEDMHHRYFVLSNVTQRVLSINDGRMHALLRRVESQLLGLSAYQSFHTFANFTCGPLQDLQTRYAQWVINKYKNNGILDADKTLVFYATELWSLTHVAETVSEVQIPLSDFKVAISSLKAEIALALKTDGFSGVPICRIQSLMEEVSELKDQMGLWLIGANDLAHRAARRADDVLTVVKSGYAHEPEPVLRLMRNMVMRGPGQPHSTVVEADEDRTSNQAWYASMSEGFNQMKEFAGL